MPGYENAGTYRRRGTRAALATEQVRGVVLIAGTQGNLHAKRATDCDCTWAVRDAEQDRRQRKRDRDREKLRPVLTLREI